jgi:hypothetical protein
MGARNRVGIGLSYRPARLHRPAELISWNRFLGTLKVLKFGLRTRLWREEERGRISEGRTKSPVPECIDPVSAKTRPKCSFWAYFRENWVYKFGQCSILTAWQCRETIAKSTNSLKSGANAAKKPENLTLLFL